MKAPCFRFVDIGPRRRGRDARRAGVVLPTVLVLLLTVCLVVGLLARFSIRSMRLARRTLDVQRAFVVAEGGLGYGVIRTRNMLTDGGISGFYANYASISTPTTPDPEYELRLLVRPISSSSSGGATVSEEGSIEVISGARNLESGVSCALRVTISAIGEMLSDYAVFFDGDLEANVGGSENDRLTFTGKIHTNGDLYISKHVTFDRNVTCTGTFHHRRKNNGSRDEGDNNKNRGKAFIRYGNDNAGTKGDLVNTWNGSDYIDEEIGSEWVAQSSLYYGDGIQTGQNGVPMLAPPISVDDVQHTLIEKPLAPSDPNYRAATEAQKFANKAALTLHVNSDGTYTLKDNVHGTDITDSLTQAELYSPGYWKGKDSDDGATKYIPGYWYGQFIEKPTWGSYEWVPQYTPAKGENDTWWMNNHPGIFVSGNGWGSDNFLTAAALASYGDTWKASATNEWNTGLNNNNYNPGYAKRVFYAKDPKTSHYVIKKKDGKRGAIQTVRKDPEDSAGVRTLGNLFVDQRQGYMMAPADIYLDEFLEIPAVKSALNDAPGGDAGISKILYVEMDEPELVKGEKFTIKQVDGVWTQTRQNPVNIKSDGYPLPCLRLRNGSDLGTDLSIVTDNPIYVEGDFNTKVVGTDSEGNAKYRSALVAGDRVTMLSKNWQDADVLPCVAAMNGKHGVRWHDGSLWEGKNNIGGTSLQGWRKRSGDRDAVETTLNAVVMTGIYPSTTGNSGTDDGYSGGLENILRYLEDWGGGIQSIFHGSIICLWDSQGDAKWSSPNWYNGFYVAPRRVWAYTRMTPPGLPGFFAVREATWERIAWSSVDWGDDGG